MTRLHESTADRSFLMSLLSVGSACLIFIGELLSLIEQSFKGLRADLVILGTSFLFLTSLPWQRILRVWMGVSIPFDRPDRRMELCARGSTLSASACLLLCTALLSGPLGDGQKIPGHGFLIAAGIWFLFRSLASLFTGSEILKTRRRRALTEGDRIDELLWHSLIGRAPSEPLLFAHRVAGLDDSEASSLTITGLTLLSVARTSSSEREYRSLLRRATNAFGQACALSPPLSLAARLAGICQLLRGDPVKALSFFSRAAELQELEAGALALEEGFALMKLQRWDEARTKLVEAEGKDPELAPWSRPAMRRLIRLSEPRLKEARDFNFFDLLARLDLEGEPFPIPGRRKSGMNIEQLMDEIEEILDDAGVTNKQSLTALLEDAKENRSLLDPTAKVILGCLAVLSHSRDAEDVS